MIDATCPHCGSVRDRPYTRKTKCKDCQEDVYVRSIAQDLIGRKTLTEKETHVFDLWREIEGILRLEPSHYKQTERRLKSKWSVTKVNPRDVVWSLATNPSLASRIPASTDDHLLEYMGRAAHILRSLADFSARYHGTAPHDLLLQASKQYLEGLKPHDKFTIHALGCCVECEKLHDTTVTRDAEKENPTIPNKGCTKKLDGTEFIRCRCWYQLDYMNHFYPEETEEAVVRVAPEQPRRSFWDLFR